MATPVFSCGFECGVSSGTQLGQHFMCLGTPAASFDTTTKRAGSRSLRSNPTSNISYATNETALSSNMWVGVFYVYFSTLPDTHQSLFGVLTNANFPVYGVYFNINDSKIYPCYRTAGGHTFGSSGVSVTTGQWYRIDFKINRTANPTLIDVQVDGTACTQQSIAVAASSDNNFRFGATETGTTDMYFDDFIMSHTSGDYPIGSGYINHFVPTADGTHNIAGANDFEIGTGGVDITNATTTAYQLVDDVPLQAGAPGTTDFINMVAPPNATDYTEHIFGPAPGISTPSAGPIAVEVIAGIAQASTATGNMEIRMNDNGTLNAMYSATAVAGVTTINYKRKQYATAIAGGGAWVIGGGGNGDFTDLRVRFGSPAAVDATPDQYFCSIMIEAAFSGDPPASTTVVKDIIGCGIIPWKR